MVVAARGEQTSLATLLEGYGRFAEFVPRNVLPLERGARDADDDAPPRTAALLRVDVVRLPSRPAQTVLIAHPLAHVTVVDAPRAPDLREQDRSGWQIEYLEAVF